MYYLPAIHDYFFTAGKRSKEIALFVGLSSVSNTISDGLLLYYKNIFKA